MSNMNDLDFWPHHLLGKRVRSTAYVIGWNIHSLNVCIATFVENVSKLVELEKVVEEIVGVDESSPLYSIRQKCGGPPSVVGVVYGPEYDGSISEDIVSKRSKSDIWIEWWLDSIPVVQRVFCCGYRYESLRRSVIMYEQPNPLSLQYYKLDPSSLFGSPLASTSDEIVSLSVESKMRYHSSRKLIENQQRSSYLESIIEEINNSHTLEYLIHERLGRIRTGESGFSIKFHHFLRSPFALLMTILKFILQMITNLLDFNQEVKKSSFFVQQVDFYCRQCCKWITDYPAMAELKNEVSVLGLIKFYNGVWLCANDILVGISVGSVIMENSSIISYIVIKFMKDYSINSIEEMVVWLMGWPAGLKLNNNLNTFLGELFLWILSVWTSYISLILPYLPTCLFLIGCSGFLGMTMIISLIIDCLSLVTMHIRLFHFVASKIYNWQMSIIFSLFHLFQGKKSNILRNRLDSTDYDVDQLLLGTILFTVLVFLFPTIAVYYFLFTYSRLVVQSIQILLQILLSVMNRFPLYPLILRLKDPFRLPSGVSFRLVMSGSIATQGPYLKLENKPLSFARIFQEYYRTVLLTLNAHFLAKPFLKGLLIGGKWESLDISWILSKNVEK